jgi:hypothetical protein
VKAPAEIVCVDCGGVCHLLSHPPPDSAGFAGEAGGEFAPGDVVAYRCADCLDRWDVVLSDEDDRE